MPRKDHNDLLHLKGSKVRLKLQRKDTDGHAKGIAHLVTGPNQREKVRLLWVM